MKPLNEIYKASFFRRRDKLSWRASYVVAGLMEVYKPSSAIDVGCAIGDVVAEWFNQGVPAYGIEGSPEVWDYRLTDMIKIHDLRLKIPHGFVSMELVTCLEVMEHVEPHYEDTLCYNLRKLTQKYLVISAAPPGQGGHHHVNCQPKEYWIDSFESKRFFHDPESEEGLRKEWSDLKAKAGFRVYYDNLICFKKG